MRSHTFLLSSSLSVDSCASASTKWLNEMSKGMGGYSTIRGTSYKSGLLRVSCCIPKLVLRCTEANRPGCQCLCRHYAMCM
ncbi:hypothetical protein BGY98DRAFT_364117 [Russula aff. rugulosa BPL654]|nr:hypothetical protein BGY98DRAFT_364117 [Russula aff. rugulosa BPL654]